MLLLQTFTFSKPVYQHLSNHNRDRGTLTAQHKLLVTRQVGHNRSKPLTCGLQNKPDQKQSDRSLYLKPRLGQVRSRETRHFYLYIGQDGVWRE